MIVVVTEKKHVADEATEGHQRQLWRGKHLSRALKEVWQGMNLPA